MKLTLFAAAILLGLLVGGLLIAFQPGRGQAAEPIARCPYGQDMDEMREHMDAIHGSGSFDAMHEDGTLPQGMMGTDGAMGQHGGTAPGHHSGGGMMEGGTMGGGMMH